MSSITKKGRVFFAQITLADGSRTSRSTGQKDIGTPAERAEARRRAVQIAAAYEEQARGNRSEAQLRRTLADLFERVNGRRLDFARTDAFMGDWLKRVAVQKSKSTHTRYSQVVREFLEALGSKRSLPLSDITTADVQAYLDKSLEQGKRPTSVRLDAKVLSVPFLSALRQGLILTNVLAAIELPAAVSEKRRPFTIQQVDALLSAAPSVDWRTIIMVGLYTGARLSDCATMRWENVDMVKGCIVFRPRKTIRHGRELTIPVHPTLARYLSELQPDPAKRMGPLAPTLSAAATSGRHGLSQSFGRLMIAAKVTEAADTRVRMDGEAASGESDGAPTRRREIRQLGFHSLRHTFNTLLANAGVAQEVRMALTGHSSERMNEVYTHRALSNLADAVGRLPGIDLLSQTGADPRVRALQKPEK